LGGGREQAPRPRTPGVQPQKRPKEKQKKKGNTQRGGPRTVKVWERSWSQEKTTGGTKEGRKGGGGPPHWGEVFLFKHPWGKGVG